MPLIPKGQRAEIPTRKHCSICSRWLLTAINFRPRGWVEDGSRPTHISSTCYSCHKAYQRSIRKPKLSQEYLRHRADQEAYVLDGKLNAIDFRLWLTSRCEEIGISNVAASVGVDMRAVRTYTDGKYMSTSKGKRKTYTIDRISVDVVEKYAIALGYHFADIYPHIANMDRAIVRNRLWKKGYRVRKRKSRTAHRPPSTPIPTVGRSDTPDLIGAYRAHKKGRKARRTSNVPGVQQDSTPSK